MRRVRKSRVCIAKNFTYLVLQIVSLVVWSIMCFIHTQILVLTNLWISKSTVLVSIQFASTLFYSMPCVCFRANEKRRNILSLKTPEVADYICEQNSLQNNLSENIDNGQWQHGRF